MITATIVSARDSVLTPRSFTPLSLWLCSTVIVLSAELVGFENAVREVV